MSSVLKLPKSILDTNIEVSKPLALLLSSILVGSEKFILRAQGS